MEMRCKVAAKIGILFAACIGLNAHSHSLELTSFDGVTPVCLHNPQGNPGPGTLFATPKIGYCNGAIDKDCASATMISELVALRPLQHTAMIRIACVGTITLLQDQQSTVLREL
jgi:hypothetical protein